MPYFSKTTRYYLLIANRLVNLQISKTGEKKMDENDIAAAFDMFDRDKNGSIDDKEVKELLRTVYKFKRRTFTEKQLDDEAKVCLLT